MKASSPIFKLLSAVVLIAVVLYFGVQLHRYLSDPVTTTLVYTAQMEDTIAMNGYLVREEETFSSADGTLDHPNAEGARVGVGQTLAVAYPNADALDKVERIGSLELHLEQLEFALSSYLDPDAALRLDSSITEGIISLQQDVSDGDYATAPDKLPALKAAVMKRDYTYTSQEAIEQDIAAVQGEIDALRASLSGTTIRAARAGTYSGAVDGYETVLTPDMLAELTVAQLSGVRPVESSANVGKLIYGDRWYYAAVITEEEAALLARRSTVTMRFAKGLGFDITASVDRIGSSENGRCVLVLHCDRYMAQTTLLRHQAAQLILKGYEGLRVPSNALRIRDDGQSGVYCVVGVSARFKPVDVLYQGDGFVLVRPVASATGTAVLRVGDEVIATAGALFDGKVIG